MAIAPERPAQNLPLHDFKGCAGFVQRVFIKGPVHCHPEYVNALSSKTKTTLSSEPPEQLPESPLFVAALKGFAFQVRGAYEESAAWGVRRCALNLFKDGC